ncbi:MAG: membrane protein insertase YidC [Elusimicrobiota bacterium]
MEKNAVFAAVLSAIVILLWVTIIKPKPPIKDAQNTVMAQEAPVIEQSIKGIEGERIHSGRDEKTLTVMENDDTRIELNSNGGVKSWLIKEKEDKVVELALLDETKNLEAFSPMQIYPRIEYTKAGGDERKGITLTGHIGDGVEIKTILSFGTEQGIVNCELVLFNETKKIQRISDFGIGLGPGIGYDEASKKSHFSDMRSLMWDGKKLYKKMKEGTASHTKIRWIGIDSRYFLAALIDNNNSFDKVTVDKRKIPVLRYSADIILEPGEQKKISLSAYWGEKKYEYLKTFNVGLDKSVKFGLFGGIGKIILRILNAFYKLTGNYGWSIILLTTLLQACLFPLTKKSTKSMQAMKGVQPKIAAIREKYKSDPKQLNIEVMNLYKKEGVNPFGGCLPMLLQLPIFWALFQTLRSAVELRYAPFILWIQDLSRPDTIGQIAGFPINILPLCMGIMMFVSQKLSSGGQDASQNTMLIMMPIVFTFMFWGFPSGLVLYWFVSNIYTTGIQLWFAKKQKA